MIFSWKSTRFNWIFKSLEFSLPWMGKRGMPAAHLAAQTVCMFSLDTRNDSMCLYLLMWMCQNKRLKSSALLPLVLSVMTLLSLQSVFSCDKDLSGFQPRDDPIHSECIDFCLNAARNIKRRTPKYQVCTSKGTRGCKKLSEIFQ